MEEEQESNDLQRHRQVAQDERECDARGGVEYLAAVEGEDVVGSSPLELPLRHEQGGGGVRTTVSHDDLRDLLGEEARERLHVQLTQGHALVVVRFGGTRDLGADQNVRISPVRRRRGATEDGPLGVDKESLDGLRKRLDEAGFYVVGAWGLAMGLVQRGP